MLLTWHVNDNRFHAIKRPEAVLYNKSTLLNLPPALSELRFCQASQYLFAGPAEMSHNTTLHLPPLLGGYPIKEDLIPSIVCSALYALLLPLFAYRLFRKSARTCVLIPMLGLVIER
jgi:hypothetical protein